MPQSLRKLHSLAQAIQQDVPKLGRPPEEGAPPETEQVLPQSIVRETRGYLERVAYQVNGCYERGWYDACAVMIRRLVEMVIIEAFEANGFAHKIQTTGGDFLYLSDLIDKALAETSWNLGRNTKKALPRLKNIGDRSAHSRRFTAQLRDIEAVVADVRDAVQEFVYLAKFK